MAFSCVPQDVRRRDGAGRDRGRRERYPAEFRRFGHLRLSIGIEDASDLVADIAQALDVAKPR